MWGKVRTFAGAFEILYLYYTMIKKQLYSAPEAQLLVVQAEGFVCASGNFDIGGFIDDDQPIDFGVIDNINLNNSLLF